MVKLDARRDTFTGRRLLVRAITLVGAVVIALATTACSGDGPQQEARPGPAVQGLPDWVPVYPGARVSGIETRTAGVETYTTFQLDSAKDCQQVFAWYDEKLKVAGFNVVGNTDRLVACDGIMRADGAGHTRALNLNGGGATGGPSRFAFQAVVRDLPGGAIAGGDARIPAWVPQYPGSKPANVVVRQEGPERSADFSFTTGDDAQKVMGWYERALKEAKFTIVTSGAFDSSTAKMTAQDATGRSIVTIRMEPAGPRKVVAIEAREGTQ
jgi:hypothetical protein